MTNLFAELKRRHVYRVAIAYAATAWLLLQLGAIVFPTLHAPSWCEAGLLAFLAVGLPVAILLAWAFEVTPEGVRRTLPESQEPTATPLRRRLGRRLDFAIIAILAAAVGILAWQLWMRPAKLGQPAGAIPEKSIAVLPLVNESGDPKEQYFSDGLSEDFITALAQFAGLKVISRDSSFQFRDSRDDAKTIGAKLGVAHLLEGSVRREGDEVRITAELVDVADGSTLWSEHYDRPYRDLFALQDAITRAVAGELKAKLLDTAGGAVAQSDRPPGGNLDAYTAYLQGRFYDAANTEAGDLKAIDYFNEAVGLDRHYAAAYAALSITWTGHAAQYLGGTDMKQAYAKARAAADAALALDPNLAAAHVARAFLLQSADFDWDGANAEFRRALQLAPEDARARFMWGVLLATLGETEPAVRLTREALVNDPLHVTWYGWLAEYLSSLGRLDEAGQAIRKAIALQPDAVGQYEMLTIIEVQRGDFQAALRAARQESPGLWQDTALALARQIGGDPAAADAALKTLIDKQADDGPYQIAEVYALRKDPDAMFTWLERAWTAGDPGISSLLYDPFIVRYKDDPRFAAFCRKVGLPVPGASFVPSPGTPATPATGPAGSLDNHI